MGVVCAPIGRPRRPDAGPSRPARLSPHRRCRPRLRRSENVRRRADRTAAGLGGRGGTGRCHRRDAGRAAPPRLPIARSAAGNRSRRGYPDPYSGPLSARGETVGSGRPVRWPWRRNATVDPETIVEWLVNNSFERVDAIDLPGQFARRGGIIDIYAPLTSGMVRRDGPAEGQGRTGCPGRTHRVLRRLHDREHSRDQPRYAALDPRDRAAQHRGRDLWFAWPSSASCSRISCPTRRSSSSRNRAISRRWPRSI